MALQSIRDILHRVSELHRQLGAYYGVLTASVRRPAVQMILAHLAAHEDRLARAVSEYERTGSESLNAWTPSSLGDEALGTLTRAGIDPDSDIEDVIDHVLQIEQALIEIYQDILRQTHDEHITTILRNLESQAKEQRKLFVRNALMMRE
jgi:rubrerythrin